MLNKFEPNPFSATKYPVEKTFKYIKFTGLVMTKEYLEILQKIYF